MATVLPDTREAQLQFFETHIDAWAANAALIGVTPAQMTSFRTLITKARDAFNASMISREAAKAATTTFYNAVDTMLSPGRDTIATIKAFADSTHNPNVYALAQIPAPSPPSPAPAPNTPTDLTGSIDPSGRLNLVWKAVPSGPSSGIVFEVTRKRGAETDFTLIAASFEKSYFDPTFRACVAMGGNLSYRVQAVRGGGRSGFAGPLEINLASGGGMMGAAGGSVVAAPAAAGQDAGASKIAA